MASVACPSNFCRKILQGNVQTQWAGGAASVLASSARSHARGEGEEEECERFVFAQMMSALGVSVPPEKSTCVV